MPTLCMQFLLIRLFAAFTINALRPGYSYTGPSGVDNSNLCKCNTVTYSLISACDACQGEAWTTYDFHRRSLLNSSWELTYAVISWSEYSFNCSKTLPPSSWVLFAAEKSIALVLTRSKWPAGSLILSLREPEYPNGLSLISRFVVMFFSMTPYSQHRPV